MKMALVAETTTRGNDDAIVNSGEKRRQWLWSGIFVLALLSSLNHL